MGKGNLRPVRCHTSVPRKGQAVLKSVEENKKKIRDRLNSDGLQAAVSADDSTDVLLRCHDFAANIVGNFKVIQLLGVKG